MRRFQFSKLSMVAVVALIAFGVATFAAVAGVNATPTPPPAFRPPSTATAVPANVLVPQPNPSLGYSISVPPTYRRAGSRVDAANSGDDIYTPRTAQQDAALCRQEQQFGSDSPERVTDFRVSVYTNPSGTSPADFANAPNRRIDFTSIQSTSVNGLAGARVLNQPSGDTAFYVIAANGRLYEIAPLINEQPMTQPHGWLDQIVSTFKALPIAGGGPTFQNACGQ